MAYLDIEEFDNEDVIPSFACQPYGLHKAGKISEVFDLHAMTDDYKQFHPSKAAWQIELNQLYTHHLARRGSLQPVQCCYPYEPLEVLSPLDFPSSLSPSSDGYTNMLNDASLQIALNSLLLAHFLIQGA